MAWLSPLNDPGVLAEVPLSPPQARHLSLSPSTVWEPPSAATLKYLARQKQRAETQLNLEAAIVRDDRGWVALWTRERSVDPPF